MISNYCKGLYTKLSSQNVSGTFVVARPPVIPPMSNGAYKYGLEVKAAGATETIKGEASYEQYGIAGWFILQFFFNIDGWGIEVSYGTAPLGVFINQVDVRKLSVYDVVVGYNLTC